MTTVIRRTPPRRRNRLRCGSGKISAWFRYRANIQKHLSVAPLNVARNSMKSGYLKRMQHASSTLIRAAFHGWRQLLWLSEYTKCPAGTDRRPACCCAAECTVFSGNAQAVNRTYTATDLFRQHGQASPPRACSGRARLIARYDLCGTTLPERRPGRSRSRPIR